LIDFISRVFDTVRDFANSTHFLRTLPQQPLQDTNNHAAKHR